MTEMQRNMKTILVTGADGQLGNEMRCVTQGSADRYLFTDVAELDITDREAVQRYVDGYGVDVVVNCAAYTQVDRAEAEPEKAELLNATAVRYLAEAMRKADGWLIHVSTDYVFGGGGYNVPCTEEVPTHPTGVYGLTKLHGEQAIGEVGCRSIILRTAWLYSEYGRNFLKTMLDLTASRSDLNVVFDQVGTPTYAFDLAEAIYHIVERRQMEGHEGIYHYSGEGVCSWYDFAMAIARQSGHTACRIHPCHSSEFPSPVQRPPYSVLDKTKFKQTFGLEPPYWTDSLRCCLTRLGQ